jgi:regulator of protease activity HflC (stomatin/prohibitin superfamily)
MLTIHALTDTMWTASQLVVTTLWNLWTSMPAAAALLALLALTLAVALGGLRRVPDGSVHTIHRFGRYVRALGPGLHFSWPLIEQVGHRIDLIGHQVVLPLGADSQRAATVYFQILDPERAGAVLDQIDAMVEREAIRRLRVLSAATESGSLAASLKQELNAQLGALGLRITRCQLGGA